MIEGRQISRSHQAAASEVSVLQSARGMLIAVSVALAVGSEGGQAAGGAVPPTRFDIPAQPLAAALETYSVASGVQVLYDSRLAVSRRSSAVHGDHLPDAALRLLLEGTGLVGRYTDTRDVVIVPRGADGPLQAGSVTEKVDVVAGVFALDTLRVEAHPRAREDYRLYAGVVQADIQRLLQQDKRTRRGRYRVGIKLWVGETGEVQRLEVFKSSGDVQRDEAISRVLANLELSEEPPDDMPQPIHVMISAWPV